MATCVLSGRVDEATRDRVSPVLRSAGMTAGELIKSVWDYMSETKEIPDLAVRQEAKAAVDPFEDYIAYCDSMPPTSDWFSNLTREEMRDVIADRYV